MLLPLRYLILLLLTIGGGALGLFLYQLESVATFRYLASNPGAYPLLHHLRPYLLVLLVLLPAITALYYNISGILDRYLVRKFLSVFFITIMGFILIWFLLELQNQPSTFKKVDLSFSDLSLYYAAQLPYIISLMVPFVLLLSCLFTLGQLSTHREIIGRNRIHK